MVGSYSDLQIYKKINICISLKLILPYDNEVISFLSSYGNNADSNSYLELLCSNKSIGKCYTYSRYVALAFISMNKNFKLYEGKLKNLRKGEFTHAWIEVDDFVYDVTFIGKYPKELYYRLFNPVIEKEIDISNDEKLKTIRENMISIQNPVEKSFQYADWYEYFNTNIPNPFRMYSPLIWREFPLKAKEKIPLSMIDNYFYVYNLLDIQGKLYGIDDLPKELFSSELSDFIDSENFIKGKDELYLELIDFINKNRKLYEEKKNEFCDITLWKKAMEEKRSGSLALFIGYLPKILKNIEENKSKHSKSR